MIDMDASLVTAHSDKEDATQTWKTHVRVPPAARRSSITAPAGVGSRWPNCCARARPARTPPPTTWRCSTRRWRSSRPRCGPATSTGRWRCWCAPTPPARPRSSPRTSPRAAWSSPSGRRWGTSTSPPRCALLPKRRGPRPIRPASPVPPSTGCRSSPATAPGSPRPPACVDMSSWPPGTRLILRKERPHPGAQLRITDADGLRVTGFLTNTAPAARPPARRPRTAPPPPRPRRGPHPRGEGHRDAQPALPRHEPEPDLARHRALAADLLAWTARLALPATAAGYEPKRLRLRILATAGRLVRTARRRVLHIDPAWPWAERDHPRPHPALRAPRALTHHPTRRSRPGAPADHAEPGILPGQRPNQAEKINKHYGRSQYSRYERLRLTVVVSKRPPKCGHTAHDCATIIWC